MAVGVLLLTHESMGDALIETSRHLLGRISLKVDALAIPPGSDIDFSMATVASRIRALDSGEGVLVLVDVFGATPSNVLDRIAPTGVATKRVSGLNLPMLLRVLNYPEQSLAELAQTAEQGGRAGIKID